jgi:hypothetical protein
LFIILNFSGNCLPDLYTSIMMQVFNTLWTEMLTDEIYKPYIETYTVLPIGQYKNNKVHFGAIECVSSVSLENFDWYGVISKNN